MKVEVESLDKVRRNVEVVLDEDKVEELRETIYQDLKKRAKIKGFRPGRVPKSVIQAYYREFIDDELKRKMVEETMGQALSEKDIRPVSEPRVQFLEGVDRHGYKMECEVIPEFELPAYEGIEVEAAPVTVTEEDVGHRIDSMRETHAEMVERPEDWAAQKGDFVIIRYEAFHEGKPVKGVAADSYPVELGSPGLLPELDAGLTGATAGDEKEIEVNFPEDYPDKEIAGKRLLFKVAVKEIKEKRLPEPGEEFAKDAGFSDVEALRSEVTKQIEKAKEAQRKAAITDQIARYLLDKTDIPVPSRLLAKRVEGLVQEARTRMKTGRLTDEEEANFNAALRKEYEPEAEKRIKMGMILGKIAEEKGIRVEDGEVDDRMKRIAEETKRAYDYIRQFYEKYDLKDNLMNSMLEEKTIGFLIERANVKEKQ